MVGDDVPFGHEAVPIGELPSPRTKLVYLYLRAADGATVEELHDALGIRYLELYGTLRVLRERNVVRNERSVFYPRDRTEFESIPTDKRLSQVE